MQLPLFHSSVRDAIRLTSSRSQLLGWTIFTPTASHLLPPSLRFLRYNKRSIFCDESSSLSTVYTPQPRRSARSSSSKSSVAL
jgi:hypothetical protein